MIPTYFSKRTLHPAFASGTNITTIFDSIADNINLDAAMSCGFQLRNPGSMVAFLMVDYNLSDDPNGWINFIDTQGTGILPNQSNPCSVLRLCKLDSLSGSPWTNIATAITSASLSAIAVELNIKGIAGIRVRCKTVGVNNATFMTVVGAAFAPAVERSEYIELGEESIQALSITSGFNPSYTVDCSKYSNLVLVANAIGTNNVVPIPANTFTNQTVAYPTSGTNGLPMIFGRYTPPDSSDESWHLVNQWTIIDNDSGNWDSTNIISPLITMRGSISDAAGMGFICHINCTNYSALRFFWHSPSAATRVNHRASLK
ncbi:MAG: hypothetical protein ACRC62_15320 [Microcoleus sp.]